MIHRRFSTLTSTVLILATLCLGPGCAKQQESPAEAKQTPPAETPSTPPKAEGIPVKASAQKNSFKEVAAHLDFGGEFLLYWSAEKALNGLSTKVSDLRGFVLSLPDVREEYRPSIEKGFDIATRLIKRSGIEEISGVGVSSIAQPDGLYRSKLIVHHDKGKGSGYMWSLFGEKAHPLSALDWLPANTVVAGLGDLNLGVLWSVISNEVVQAGVPQGQELLQSFPNEFEKATRLKLDQLLASLGGEYGMVVTMDATKKIPIPVPPQPILVPEPGFLLLMKVKDDTVFERIEALLTENETIGKMVVRTDKEGLKMRTVPVPLPLPIQVRPTLARAGEYLLLASTDTLVEEALAASKQQKPGWKSSAEYRKLSQGLPTEGNQVFFVSEKFGEVITQIQKQALQSNPQIQTSHVEALQKFFGANKTAYSFTVGANTEEGWLVVGNGNTASSQMLLGAAVAAPAGLLAGVALPAFVKARDKAQRITILNNLKMIDGAKEQWAIENKKKVGEAVTEADLAPFLPGGKIKVIKGETYQINSIGKSPTVELPDGSSLTLP